MHAQVIRVSITLSYAEMYEEAEHTLQEAISIMPDHSQFYFTLGVMLGRLQRYEVKQKFQLQINSANFTKILFFQEAEKLLLTAISMNPATARYHANLGNPKIKRLFLNNNIILSLLGRSGVSFQGGVL